LERSDSKSIIPPSHITNNLLLILGLLTKADYSLQEHNIKLNISTVHRRWDEVKKVWEQANMLHARQQQQQQQRYPVIQQRTSYSQQPAFMGGNLASRGAYNHPVVPQVAYNHGSTVPHNAYGYGGCGGQYGGQYPSPVSQGSNTANVQAYNYAPDPASYAHPLPIENLTVRTGIKNPKIFWMRIVRFGHFQDDDEIKFVKGNGGFDLFDSAHEANGIKGYKSLQKAFREITQRAKVDKPKLNNREARWEVSEDGRILQK